MTLNHLGVVVSEVEATRAFLERYFGLVPIGPASPKLMHLQDDKGFILSLTEGDPERCHIGFIQETEGAVDALYARLKADGVAADPPRRSHGWGFYLRAPGGLIIEVVC